MSAFCTNMHEPPGCALCASTRCPQNWTGGPALLATPGSTCAKRAWPRLPGLPSSLAPLLTLAITLPAQSLSLSLSPSPSLPHYRALASPSCHTPFAPTSASPNSPSQPTHRDRGLAIPPPPSSWHPTTLALLHWGVLRVYRDPRMHKCGRREGEVGEGGVGEEVELGLLCRQMMTCRLLQALSCDQVIERGIG